MMTSLLNTNTNRCSTMPYKTAVLSQGITRYFLQFSDG